ncbi:hypothetical protein F1988_05680 [Alistipes indistinctus]|nr:hypothetical protein F1988_05680 [Alistipes indistinctus]
MMQGIFWKYIRRCAVALLLAAGIFAVGLLSAKRTHGAAVQQIAAADSTRGTAAADKAAGRNQPQVRAELSADTVLIGHRFKLRVEVTKDVMQMVAFPEFENGRLTDSLEILLEGPVDTVSREGRTEVLAREYLLTCFSPADYRLGRFPALYADKNLVDTIWSPDSLRVIVTAPPVDTASHTIYDIKAPLKVPLRFGEVSGYLLFGLIAALLIAVAIYVLLLKRGRGLLAALRGPADPPHVAAIKQLEKLHTQKLWQSGKSKQYYTGLTDILREYLAGRYNFQAMEMTSAEIIARIRELSVEERASKRLGSLLEVADFVKFAKYEPDAVQNEDAYQDAYYFVEETKQLPPELQPQQAGNDTPQGNVPGPTGTSGGLKPSGVPGAPDIPDTPGGAAAGGTSDEAGEGKEVRS